MKIRFIKPIRLPIGAIPRELQFYLNRDLEEVVGLVVPLTGRRAPDSRQSVFVRRQDLAFELDQKGNERQCRDLALALDHPKVQQVDKLNCLKIPKDSYEFVN